MRQRIEWMDRTDALEAGAPWTPYQEFGTRYVDAQPMLRPAELAVEADAVAAFSDLFE